MVGIALMYKLSYSLITLACNHG